MSINLDDYEKVPCSAKEAGDWMYKSNHNYCYTFVGVMRIDVPEIQRYSDLDDTWAPYEPINGYGLLLKFDWFKLVPKEKRNDNRFLGDNDAFPYFNGSLGR